MDKIAAFRDAALFSVLESQLCMQLRMDVPALCAALQSQLPLMSLALVVTVLAWAAPPASLAWGVYCYVAALTWAVVLRAVCFSASDYWSLVAKQPETGSRRNAFSSAALAPLLLAKHVALYQSSADAWSVATPVPAATWWPLPLACVGQRAVRAVQRQMVRHAPDVSGGHGSCSSLHAVFVCGMPSSTADLPRDVDVLLDLDPDVCCGAAALCAVKQYIYLPAFPGTLPAEMDLVAVLYAIANTRTATPQRICVAASRGSRDARALIVAALLLSLLHTGAFGAWREHYVVAVAACGSHTADVPVTAYQRLLADRMADE